MGKQSCDKGRRGEQEVASLLREKGYSVQRGGVDSFGELLDVYGMPGVHLEIKRAEQLRLFEWMMQSVRDSKRFKDGLPVVIHRKSREPWLCTMLFTDWLELYQRANSTPLPSEPDNRPEMTARPHQFTSKPNSYRGCR